MMTKNKVILGGVAVVALGAVFLWGNGLVGDLASVATGERRSRRPEIVVRTNTAAPTTNAMTTQAPTETIPPTPTVDCPWYNPFCTPTIDPSIYSEGETTTRPSEPTECYCYNCSQITESQKECSNSCTEVTKACDPGNQDKQNDFNQKAADLGRMITNKDPNANKTLDDMADELDKKLDDQDVGNLINATIQTLEKNSITINPDTPMGSVCDNKEIKTFKFAISAMNSNLEEIKKLCAEGGGCNMESFLFRQGEVYDNANIALALVNAKLTDANITSEQREAFLELRRKIYEVTTTTAALTQKCSEETLKVLEEQQKSLLAVSAASLATVLTAGICSPALVAATVGTGGGSALLITGAIQSAAIMGTAAYDAKLLEPVIQAYGYAHKMDGNMCDNFWVEYSKINPAARKEAIKAGLYNAAIGAVGGAAAKIPSLLKNGFLGAKFACAGWTTTRIVNGVKSVGAWKNGVWVEEKVVARLVNGNMVEGKMINGQWIEGTWGSNFTYFVAKSEKYVYEEIWENMKLSYTVIKCPEGVSVIPGL